MTGSGPNDAVAAAFVEQRGRLVASERWDGEPDNTPRRDRGQRLVCGLLRGRLT